MLSVNGALGAVQELVESQRSRAVGTIAERPQNVLEADAKRIVSGVKGRVLDSASYTRLPQGCVAAAIRSTRAVDCRAR